MCWLFEKCQMGECVCLLWGKHLGESWIRAILARNFPPFKAIGPPPTHSHFKTHLNLMNNFLGGYHHVFFHVNHRQFFSRCKNNINLSRCTSLNGSQGWTNYFFWNVVFFMFFFEITRLNLGHFALIEFGHWGTFCVRYFVWFFVFTSTNFLRELGLTWIQSASGNQRFSLKKSMELLDGWEILL